MRRIVILVAVAGALWAMSVPAGAQVPDITIPIDTVIRRQPIGSTHQLASEPVPAELVGTACVVTVDGVNNDSVHPGNNLVVSSGGSSVTAFDVERAALVDTPAVGTLTLGDTVVVSVVLGDGDLSPNLQTFSGGLLVHIDCTTPPPTTPPTTATTTPPTTATTTPPTTATTTPPTTATTTPPTTATTTPPTTDTTPTAPTTTTPPDSIEQQTIADTGMNARGPATFAGLALVAAGAFLVVLVEFWRRTRTAAEQGRD